MDTSLKDFLEEYSIDKKRLYPSFSNFLRSRKMKKYYVNYPEGYFIVYIDKTTDKIITKDFKFY